MTATAHPVLAETVRSGFVESVHRGSLIALAADGSADFAAGEVDVPVFPRSSNKPMQAVAMLRAGLELDGELLALAAASHSGEPIHLDGVRRILRLGGLEESALQTPPDLPVEEQARERYLAAGGTRQPVAMNCSGKHAGMLVTCVVNGWDTSTYLDPSHPLQVGIRETVEDLAEEKVEAVGVDGCGAPVLALSLTGLATAFRTLVLAAPGTPERRLADAMRRHPDYVGGTHRDVSALMTAVPGLLAKDGAEGVYAVALDDGRAVSLKVDDGAQRARPPILVAALRRLGVDGAALDQVDEIKLLGGGQPVGAVRAVPW